MDNGTSEIDDPRFFLAKDGKTNAKNELDATIEALLHETKLDDNATACLFPARKTWLKEQLNIKHFPKVTCKEYTKVFNRIDPKSATIVFPAAHINSPASMFGHTFLRINSSYDSKLLSYAVNYAANTNADTENGVVFAIKGLLGGYLGRYSLLPYYEKLKEYKDTEQRDIWEYNLNLNETEVKRMVEHIWELNNANSFYYFFTENCSYNILWLLEIARPGLKLRDKFNLNVIPLETIHVAKKENLLADSNFRASKRTILLKYEDLIHRKFIDIPANLVKGIITPMSVKNNTTIPQQQKMYILEAAIEYLEYTFTKGKIPKEKYLSLFHEFSKQRAALGIGDSIEIQIPDNPLKSHRAIRVSTGFGVRENKKIGFLGLRPAYHSLEDSGYGFLRGTQIEFLNLDLSYSEDTFVIEDATILSIVSLAQRSEFFDVFSWRTKFAFDRDYIGTSTNFIASVGGGFSWGNELGYVYALVDPLFYINEDKLVSGLGSTLGFVMDKYNYMNTNIELTSRYYDNAKQQYIINASQNFRVQQNVQLQFKYDFKEKYNFDVKREEETLRVVLNYYF